MARLKVICTSCTAHLVIWGTHDDLVVNLTTERLARSARCPTCGAILERWPVVQTSDKTQLTGNAVNAHNPPPVSFPDDGSNSL